jgi:hypothetical protein
MRSASVLARIVRSALEAIEAAIVRLPAAVERLDSDGRRD